MGERVWMCMECVHGREGVDVHGVCAWERGCGCEGCGCVFFPPEPKFYFFFKILF